MTPPPAISAVELVESGDLHWESSDLPAVAEVDLLVGRGVSVVVDVAAPATVLAWRIDAGADPAPLADAVTDTALPDAVAAARRGDTVRLGTPRLNESWTRLAMAESVSRWSPRPIDEGALLLDEAAARYGTGNGPAAARLVALAAPTLTDLAHQSLAGRVVGGAAAELSTVTTAAAAAVRDLHWAGEIESLAERLGAVSPFTDADLADWMSGLTADAALSLSPALSMSGDPTVAVDPDIAFDSLDPHAVPARVFDSSDLGREVITERHGAEILVTVRLAAHLDPDAIEPQHFLAYAADRETGRIRDTIPMTRDGRTLVGTLLVEDPPFAGLTFGVCHIDTDLRGLRNTPLGRTLVEVDRLMIEAWNRQRSALAILHRTDAASGGTAHDRADAESKARLADARRAAQDAHGLLTEQIARLPADADTVRGLLTARLDAVQRFRVTLRKVTAVDGSTRPLLSELLPVDPWDEQ